MQHNVLWTANFRFQGSKNQPVKSTCHYSATRVNSIEDYCAMILTAYLEIFKGLGIGGTIWQCSFCRCKALYASNPKKSSLPTLQESETGARMHGVYWRYPSHGWALSMECENVSVQKKSREVRICVDLKPLNLSVQRETHPLPKVDDVLSQLSGAIVLSKLVANSGFWQIPLISFSCPFTTFITLFRRYHFNKLPFGIAGAPEHFQKMWKMLAGLEGTVCLMNDVLVFGRNDVEHDHRLRAVLHWIALSGVTLNPEKCQLCQIELNSWDISLIAVEYWPTRVSAPSLAHRFLLSR